MAYEKPKAGEWVKPKRRFYKLACCDCGLVHKMEFKVARYPFGHGRAVYFRAWRDNRATAALRRKKNKPA